MKLLDIMEHVNACINEPSIENKTACIQYMTDNIDNKLILLLGLKRLFCSKIYFSPREYPEYSNIAKTLYVYVKPLPNQAFARIFNTAFPEFKQDLSTHKLSEVDRATLREAYYEQASKSRYASHPEKVSRMRIKNGYIPRS